MLVHSPLVLTVVVVAMSLVALLEVVTSTKTEAGASKVSEDLALHATKSSPRNLSLSLRSQEKGLSALKSGARSVSDLKAGLRNNSGMIQGTPREESTQGKVSRAGRKNSDKSKSHDDIEVPDTEDSSFWSEDVQVGCKELRARRYISDGFCTSEEPIKEVACAGSCLPIMDMPWYAEFVKTLAKSKLKEWQCVEDVVRKKRVKLLCQNGTFRHYRIKVVESCQCKKITDTHNRTTQKKKKKKKRRKKEEKTKSNSGS